MRRRKEQWSNWPSFINNMEFRWGNIEGHEMQDRGQRDIAALISTGSVAMQCEQQGCQGCPMVTCAHLTLPVHTQLVGCLVQVWDQPSLCLSSCGICKVLNPSTSFCHLQSKNTKCNRQTAGYSVELCLPSGLGVLASSQDPSTCDISDGFNQAVHKTMLIEFSQLPEKFILLV